MVGELHFNKKFKKSYAPEQILEFGKTCQCKDISKDEMQETVSRLSTDRGAGH